MAVEVLLGFSDVIDVGGRPGVQGREGFLQTMPQRGQGIFHCNWRDGNDVSAYIRCEAAQRSALTRRHSFQSYSLVPRTNLQRVVALPGVQDMKRLRRSSSLAASTVRQAYVGTTIWYIQEASMTTKIS